MQNETRKRNIYCAVCLQFTTGVWQISSFYIYYADCLLLSPSTEPKPPMHEAANDVYKLGQGNMSPSEVKHVTWHTISAVISGQPGPCWDSPDSLVGWGLGHPLHSSPLYTSSASWFLASEHASPVPFFYKSGSRRLWHCRLRYTVYTQRFWNPFAQLIRVSPHLVVSKWNFQRLLISSLVLASWMIPPISSISTDKLCEITLQYNTARD